MKKFALSIAVIALCWAFGTTAAHATVLNFDGIPDLTLNGGANQNYDGVLFTNWNNYSWSQPPYYAHSGSGRVYATFASGNNNNMGFSSLVTFDGAWFSGLDTTSVTFEGYQGSTLEWTSAPLTTTDVPTFLNFGSTIPVDNVVVDSSAQDYYVMDDVTFNQSTSTSPVPEPATMGLFAVGLIGLVGARRILALA